MDIAESIKLALEGLKTNKMRSFLTMLGIIIGISSVIAIMTIGRAMSNSVSKSFDSISSNLIYVSVSAKSNSKDYENYPSFRQSDMITDEMIDKLIETYPKEIKAIGLIGENKSAQIRDGKEKANINIYTVNPGTRFTENVKMQTGRYITEKDLQSNRNVAVISDKVVKKIFDNNPKKALGNEIAVYIGDKLEVFSVVGIYKYESQDMGMFGGNSGQNPDDVTTKVYVPLTLSQSLMNSSDDLDGYGYLTVDATNKSIINTLSDNITKFFNDNYYKNNDLFEVTTQSVESITNQINKSLGAVKLAIGAIAAISLLVGGIGVMNILLVSVTERTREIGIRKALGATNTDIKAQFIIESIIICIIGGIIGVLLGMTIGFIGSTLMKEPTLPSILSILIAVGFSMFIGVFFGYYPANKAAKLDPIDALRYE